MSESSRFGKIVPEYLCFIVLRFSYFLFFLLKKFHGLHITTGSSLILMMVFQT